MKPTAWKRSPGMHRSVWAATAASAILFPARLAGPLDGVPLDTTLEVVLVGLLLPWLLCFHRDVFTSRSACAIVLALVAWKGMTHALVSPDGWCIRFMTPAPVYHNMGVVPHSWDIRADWRSATPDCSAIMTRLYGRFEEFPIWFYNLPPLDDRPAQPTDRPPLVTMQLTLTGFLAPSRPGVFRVDAGTGLKTSIAVDGTEVTGEATGRGLTVDHGMHHVAIRPKRSDRTGAWLRSGTASVSGRPPRLPCSHRLVWIDRSGRGDAWCPRS